MQLQQIYTNCLAQGAYYIESNGEAAIIDPLREVKPYLEMAEQRGAKIKYIFETHFHADFVSGHVDLAKKTGAQIVYGPTTMKTGFEFITGTDGQEFKLGKVTLKLVHTPGHTMESSCYLLTDEEGKETALFSGDTLFIGDVGRPDLAQHVIADLTQEKLAGHLYDSLRLKILPLADDLIVYPGHGAGSACGKNLSKETSDTLGHQKQTNYALNPMLSKEEFIKEVLSGLMPPPAYFPKNVLMNINGYDEVDDVILRGTQPVAVTDFMKRAEEKKAVIIDTRPAAEFSKGFIPGSLNIGIDGSFAVWVGTVIKDINQPILIVAQPGRDEEIVIRLARVGYDQSMGYLQGGFEAWKNGGLPVETVSSLEVEAFAERLKSDSSIQILDVRKQSEYESEHIRGAKNTPLDYFEKYTDELDPAQTYYVHCAAGYRSMVYISLMRQKGFKNLIDVTGGFSKIKASGLFEISEYASPATML